MAAHQYWRLFFLTGVTNEIDITEVEWYTAHNTDTSAATGGTAISGENYDGTWVAARAYNGTKTGSDGWAATTSNTYGSTKWLGYQFSSPVDITGYAIWPNSASYYPLSWKVQYSDDGSSWTDHATHGTQTMVSGHSATGFGWCSSTNAKAKQAFRVAPDTSGSGARFWRLKVVEVNSLTTSASDCDLSAVEFKASGAVLHKASTRAYASSMFDTGFVPNYASDSTDDGNEWATGVSTDPPHYFTYDFGTKVQPDQLRVRLGDNNPNTHKPTAFKIEYSQDGSSWTETDSYTGQFSGTVSNNAVVTVSVSAVAGGSPARRRPVIICC